MDSGKLRVIVLTHGGTELALEKLFALDCATVAGVFVETDTVRSYTLLKKVRRSLRYDGFAATIAKIGRAMRGRESRYGAEIAEIENSRDRLRQFAQEHRIPFHLIQNYHSDNAIGLMRAAEPDLGVVLGTNLLRESVFKIPRLGSINLHHGLAPYYRGGSAIFWELFNGETELGLTVHFVKSNVDAGDIVLQETVPLVYDYLYGLDFESFISDFHDKLKDRGATLVASAVKSIAEGTASPRPQDIGLGQRYRLPTKKEKDELRRRLRQRKSPSFAGFPDRHSAGPV
jgi:folate-dependent phosphoribosylglycinamide formyltransferase PurN